MWQDAYDFNKSLPDDVFELLLINSNGKDLSIEGKEISVTEDGYENPKVEDINAYGAKSKIVKDFIASKHGVDKKSLVNHLQTVHNVEKKKAESMATNTITALVKSNEIEAFKRGKYRIKKK